MADETSDGAFRPITEAPVKPGERWGPCLLRPGLDGHDIIGEYDGHEWCDAASGFVVQPLFWRPIE
jgi:hypothetical protein